MSKSSGTNRGGVLVSDFDGTMTRRDFYKLAIESLLPADVPDDLRFARGDLAEVLRSERLLFHSFDSWSDIADRLLQRGT